MNKSNNLVFLLGVICLALVIYGCKEKTSRTESEAEYPRATDDEIAALYNHFKQKPSNLKEREENAIIDFAVSKDLPLNRLDNGVYYLLQREGKGPFLRYGETIKVDYKGFFLDGRLFDSSYAKKKPITFQIGQMIQGWNHGLTPDFRILTP